MLVNGHILIPDTPDWSAPPDAERLWKTGISEALPGNEARKTVDFAPPIKLSFTLRQQHSGPQQEFEDTVCEALKTGLAAVPLHGMAAVLVSQDGAEIVVDSIQEGWRADEYLFFSDQNPENPTWEVRQIVSIAGTTITLESALDETWPEGALVWRLIFGRLTSPTQQEAWDYWNGKPKLTLTEREGSTFQGLGDLLFFDPHCYFINGTAIAVEGTDTVYPSSYACVGGWNWCASGGPPIPACGRVMFTPASGQAIIPCDVVLSVVPTSEGPPAIHYTTNGKTPTANSPLYSAPIHLTAAATIKAIAMRDRFYDGPVCLASYGAALHLDPPQVPSGTVDVADNTHTDIIQPTQDTNTRGTTDGSDPTATSPIITEPIPITEDTTVKVVTEKDGEISDPVTVVYSYSGTFEATFVGWTGNQWHARVVATVSADTIIDAIFSFPLMPIYSWGFPRYITGYDWNQTEGWSNSTTLSVSGVWLGGWDTPANYYPKLLTVELDSVPVNTTYQRPLMTLPAGEHTIDLYGTAQYIGYTMWRGVIVAPNAGYLGVVKQWRFDIFP